MSTIMDLYLNSGCDSLSMQDMFDTDIKSEVDAIIGGHNDLTGFNFTDLPLDFEDSEIRFISSNSNHSNYSFNFDLSDDSSTMVNPNAVMPISFTHDIRSPSPQLKRSHLTFSPCSIKIAGFRSTAAAELKKDLLEKLNTVEDKQVISKATTKTKSLVMVKPVIKTKTTPAILTYKNTVQNPTPITHNVKIHAQNGNRTKAPVKATDSNVSAFPKPPYSYSCLIAMALKNSCTGCLPVSEIYNFICRHFPYFKTAPGAWKNSVRHNLSLNKSFKKIEKLVLNGSQRKGCLWGMNQNKIAKMDEEVQKCSKKDPNLILKAMLNPENLGLLERGELKFTYDDADVLGDSCGSAESGEESEIEVDIDNCIGKTNYININNIKTELESDLEEESLYNEIDIEEDKEVLRVEMALAQKELLGYENAEGIKRRKLYIIQN